MYIYVYIIISSWFAWSQTSWPSLKRKIGCSVNLLHFTHCCWGLYPQHCVVLPRLPPHDVRWGQDPAKWQRWVGRLPFYSKILHSSSIWLFSLVIKSLIKRHSKSKKNKHSWFWVGTFSLFPILHFPQRDRKLHSSKHAAAGHAYISTARFVAASLQEHQQLSANWRRLKVNFPKHKFDSEDIFPRNPSTYG